MSNISASSVRALREKTGAGIMDCKTALTATNSDMAAAVDWLRTKGLAEAAKKAGRVAAEGLVVVALENAQPPRRGAVVEINSETDFVARNKTFQEFAGTVAQLALQAGGDLDKLLRMRFPGTDVPVSEHVKSMVATVGENISVRRCALTEIAEGTIVPYVHNKIAADMGKIAVLVALNSRADPSGLYELGRQLAMHVASADPLSLREDDLDRDVIARERAVFTEQARALGKPENIVENIVKGRLGKFFKERVLLAQTFVIDGETSIGDVLETASQNLGASVAIDSFIRFQLGEGIEKSGSDPRDFADEVAAIAGT